MNRRTIALQLATLLTAAVIVGCADSEHSSLPPTSTSTSTTSAGATTATGTFTLLPTAPEGFDELAGTAKLIRSDDGTDAWIQLEGLKPKLKYASHLHAGACDQPDPGGPHFRFELNGSDVPPNEIHLPFTSDETGNATAKAHNDQTVPEGKGRSIVVHRDPGTSVASGTKKPTAASGQGHHSAAASGKTSGAKTATTPPKIACAPLPRPARTSENSSSLK